MTMLLIGCSSSGTESEPQTGDDAEIKAGSACKYGGQVVKVGKSVKDLDGCNSCTCNKSGKSTFMACTELACAPKPKVCIVGGVTHAAGSSFASGDGCNTCTCREDGNAACTELFCG